MKQINENKRIINWFVVLISSFIFCLLFVFLNNTYNEINETDTIRLQTIIHNIIIDNNELKSDKNIEAQEIIKDGIKIIDLYKSYKTPLKIDEFNKIDILYVKYYKKYNNYTKDKDKKDIYNNIDNLIKNNIKGEKNDK